MFTLHCSGCGTDRAPGPTWFGCPDCNDAAGNPHWLEARYDLGAIPVEQIAAPGRLWDYAPLLPVTTPGRTLGEGATPLLRIDALNDILGVRELWLKLECVSPTGSFKDRNHAVSMTVAREHGWRRAVITSTGNAGVACAAYGALNGIQVVVIVDPKAPAEHRRMMRQFGATVVVPGGSGPVIGTGEALMESLVRWHGFMPATVQGTHSGPANPFGIEGYKTIAFEIAAALGRAPDRVFVPTAGGDGLCGHFKGYRELRDLGIIDRLPRMTACQPEGANFAVRAVRAGADRFTAVEPDTIAISIGDHIGSTSILEAIAASGGDAWDASDEQILDALALLGRHGVAVEAASATSIAALRNALAAGVVDPDEQIVAVLTGSSMRWPHQVDAAIGGEVIAPEDPNQIVAVLDQRSITPRA